MPNPEISTYKVCTYLGTYLPGYLLFPQVGVSKYISMYIQQRDGLVGCLGSYIDNYYITSYVAMRVGR